MNPSIWFILVILLIIIPRRKRMKIAAVKIQQKKRMKRKDRSAMNEIIKNYIGKDCIIYNMNGEQITGIITSAVDGWITVQEPSKEDVQAINLDYVIRVREFPYDKNGKRKSFY